MKYSFYVQENNCEPRTEVHPSLETCIKRNARRFGKVISINHIDENHYLVNVKMFDSEIKTITYFIEKLNKVSQ